MSAREPTPTSYGTWARNRAPQRTEVALLEDGTGGLRMTIVILVAEGDHADRVNATRRSIDNQHHAPSQVIEALAGSLTKAVEQVSAEWFAVVVAGQLLQPRALLATAAMLTQDNDTDVVYTDEDRYDQAGERIEPILKPGWSPRLLLEGNYAGGITFMRRSAVVEVGGLHPDDEPSGCYDTLLRLSEQRRPFLHVAEPLLTSGPGSTWPVTAGGAGRAAGKRCVERALTRRQVAATVTAPTDSPWFRMHRKRPARPPITVIVPTRDRRDLLESCIESLESTTSYPSHQIMVVDNDSRDPETLAYFEATPHQVLRVSSPFNFSSIVNAAVDAAQTEYVVLLNNDTVALDGGWLEAMVDEALNDGVGAVGCTLIDAAGNVVHEGVGLGLRGACATNLRMDGYLRLGDAVREVSAVTAACMLINVTAFHAVRGFDPRLRIGYGDVDFCLRLWRHGYSVRYTPHSVMRHTEGASRADLSDAVDEQLFRRLWGDHEGSLEDPFINPQIDDFAPIRLASGPIRDSLGDNLRADLDRATVYARELERHVAELESEQASATAHIKALESTLQQAAERRVELEEVLRERMAELRTASMERRHLQLDLQVKDEYVSQLRSGMTTASQRVDAMAHELEVQRAEVEQREAVINAQLARLELLRYRVADRLNNGLLRIPFLHRALKSSARTSRKSRP